MARPSRRPNRRLDVEDGRTPAGPSYEHPVSEDEWAESERERRERRERMVRRARLANSSAAQAIDARLRARGIQPPSKPY